MAVGKSLPRKDARVKVKGEAEYIYDVIFPDNPFMDQISNIIFELFEINI